MIVQDLDKESLLYAFRRSFFPPAFGAAGKYSL